MPANLENTRPKKSKGSTFIVIKGVTLFVAFVISALWLNHIRINFPNKREISFDFTDNHVANQWSLQGKGLTATVSKNGLAIKAKQPFTFLSPLFNNNNSIPGNGLYWPKSPYLKIALVKNPEERKGVLLSRRNDSSVIIDEIKFKIPRMTDEIIIDTQEYEYWNFRFPLRYPGMQFALQFSDNITIRRITVTSSLTLAEFAGLLYDQYFDKEIFQPYTINGLHGVYLLGMPLIFYPGIIIIFSALLLFVRRNRTTKTYFIIFVLLSCVLFDLQFSYSLGEQALYSYGRSAWHYSRYDEYKSRFGKKFADLAKEFATLVPPRAKVFFPREKSYTVRGESNWIEFLFYPEYQSVDITRADFIFYYHPKDIVLQADKKIIRVKQGKAPPISVEPVYKTADDAQILRVVHE